MPESEPHSTPIYSQRLAVIYTMALIFHKRYDTWGRRRNPDDWSYDDVPTSHIFDRGFTGHQHLDQFGLINMNGRVYDPKLGRFLSPDNNIQAPDNPQNYNRYAYALNNPLKYTDPSGDALFTTIATLVPGLQPLIPLAVSMDIAAFQGAARADMNGGNVLEGYAKGAATGLVGGVLAPIGGAGMSFGKNLAYGVAEGAAVGAFDAWIWGNDVGQGMLGGAIGGAVFTTLESENFSNLLKKGEFLTNANLYENMMANGVDKQKILDYFGFEGMYDPGHEIFSKIGPEPAATNAKNGDIVFNKYPFEGSYDRLKAIALHETQHSNNVLSGKYDNIKIDAIVNATEEYNTWLYTYRNQGLYPNHGIDILKNIRLYGTQAGIHVPEVTPSGFRSNIFKEKWWHFIYKIPRRW